MARKNSVTSWKHLQWRPSDTKKMTWNMSALRRQISEFQNDAASAAVQYVVKQKDAMLAQLHASSHRKRQWRFKRNSAFWVPTYLWHPRIPVICHSFLIWKTIKRRKETASMRVLVPAHTSADNVRACECHQYGWYPPAEPMLKQRKRNVLRYANAYFIFDS